MVQVDRLKCLVHRITLQQLLACDFLHQPQEQQGILMPSSHLQAVLKQPTDRAISAEAVADRILEWAAGRRPPSQAGRQLEQEQKQPCSDASQGSMFSAPDARTTIISSAGDAASAADSSRPHAPGGRAERRSQARGSRRDGGGDSGAASVSGSDRGSHSSSAATSPSAARGTATAAAGNGEPSPRTAGASRPAEHPISSECQPGNAEDSSPNGGVEDGKEEGSPRPQGAKRAATTDVGHLTPGAMHAGLRVAAARAQAAELGAQLDQVLAERARSAP